MGRKKVKLNKKALKQLNEEKLKRLNEKKLIQLNEEKIKQRKEKKKTLNIFLLIAVLCELGFAILFFVTVGIEIRPEQSAQVEAVGRRITREFSISKRDYSTYFTYIVSFKFSDGSVKEINVDITSRRGNQDTAPNSFRYDAMQEGVTGILTYKELEDIEQKYENEESYYAGRKFVSFQQNLEYGGALILGKTKNWDIGVWATMGIGVIVFGVIVFLIVLRIKIQKKDISIGILDADKIVSRLEEYINKKLEQEKHKKI